jgi:hypothetical protein
MEEKLQYLFSETNRILKKQDDFLETSGEDFNIFSITKIERYENNTHSAMIAELLDPNGSHHQKDLFLREFLNIVLPIDSIDYNRKMEIDSFLAQRVTVKKEQSFGAVDLKNGTGGRMDILIRSFDKCFIIENKIDARDQDQQILRSFNYDCNYKKVFYLTLYGDNAPESSAMGLKANIDYYPISYKTHIVDWLEACKQKCKNLYIQGCIHHYLNLVKKITNQLERMYMEELNDLIRNNLREANQISTAIEDVIKSMQQTFRLDLSEKLQKELKDQFTVMIYGKISDSEASIYILPLEISKPPVSIAVMGFNGYGDENGKIYIGIFNESGNKAIATEIEPEYISKKQPTLHFPKWEFIVTGENNNLNLRSINTLAQFKDKTYYDKLINKVVEQIVEFTKNNRPILDKINQLYKEL